jgi:hypothetical protein
MGTVAGAKTAGKWPEAGSPPTEWFEALGHIEACFHAYMVAHGMEGGPSPDAALRTLLEGFVTSHAYMRARKGSVPSSAEWRTAGRHLATLARYALEFGVMPLDIPSGADDRLCALLCCILPEDETVANALARGGYSLERADLVLLAERAVPLAKRFRDRQGRKADTADEALRELRRSVSDIIEMYCGPESATCYGNDLDGPGGLLYEVVAQLQPWLLGLEDLTPNALRQALQRAGPRRPRVKAQNSRRTRKF